MLLALLQNSLALAVLGVTGGFLAPILTSTGSGNHVLLFSYYALLNAGHPGDRLVPLVAAFEPGRLRVHLRDRFVVGLPLLPAGAARQHRAVPGLVPANVRRDRGAVRVPPAAGPARLRRRHAGVRRADRRRAVAGGAGARHRIRRSPGRRSGSACSTSLLASALLKRAPQTARTAGRGLPRPRRDIRHARHPAGARRRAGPRPPGRWRAPASPGWACASSGWRRGCSACCWCSPPASRIARRPDRGRRPAGAQRALRRRAHGLPWRRCSPAGSSSAAAQSYATGSGRSPLVLLCLGPAVVVTAPAGSRSAGTSPATTT
ncbi:MAG: DUF2339 domain-containing protein [Desulfosudis oleivorans]|nr:DUF2339 domain-containing protein [Desulfosudis oleivorans]